MIDAVNEALRLLVMQELPVRDNEIEIAFNQPKREWSGRLSRPTLNFYLFDVRQNIRFKNASPGFEVTRRGDGKAEQQRAAPRVDLNYMITAWAIAPEDEHRLLARVFMALYRSTEIPAPLMPEILHNQPYPIPIQLGALNELTRPTEIWGVLDNELRPAITCTLTIALDPFAPLVGPLVQTREIRISQRGVPNSEEVARFSVGGYIQGIPQLTGVRLTLLERALPILLEDDGSWSVGRIRAGTYTLQVTSPGTAPRQFPLEVPSPSYDIVWET
jgi:hypothetical protein